MDFKIKMVRFYQSVVINGTAEMYCTSPEYVTHRRDGKDNSSITLHDKGVIIENDKDLVLVSWNNIASVAFDKSVPLAPKISKKEKSEKEPVDFRKI